jgi:hypothetical protein
MRKRARPPHHGCAMACADCGRELSHRRAGGILYHHRCADGAALWLCGGCWRRRDEAITRAYHRAEFDLEHGGRALLDYWGDGWGGTTASGRHWRARLAGGDRARDERASDGR